MGFGACTEALEGAVAQSVEQRTENPCVAGSIPAHTTKEDHRDVVPFCLYQPRLVNKTRNALQEIKGLIHKNKKLSFFSPNFHSELFLN